MPAPLRIILSEEEDQTLSELREAQTVAYLHNFGLLATFGDPSWESYRQ